MGVLSHGDRAFSCPVLSRKGAGTAAGRGACAQICLAVVGEMVKMALRPYPSAREQQTPLGMLDSFSKQY